jgi:CRP/FNR family cyclic AMP-dependent transcriptional regulator
MVSAVAAPTEETVCVLDALPEVVPLLDPDDVTRARDELVAPRIDRPAGEWRVEPSRDPLAMGLLVVEGVLARNVRLGEATTTELVGPGDRLRPAHWDDADAPIQVGIEWAVLEPACFALLDREVTAAVCRWQAVVTAIVGAAIERAWTLAQLLAVSHLRRVDVRLLALFWLLADRFGRVQPGGVTVPLKLTHEALGHVVGAKRPSVTTALNQLEASGRVSRREGGGWLLHGDPPNALRR